MLEFICITNKGVNIFMKKKAFFISLSVFLLSIGGCSSNTNEVEGTAISSEKISTIESTIKKTMNSEKTSISENSEINDSSIKNESSQSIVSSSKDSLTESNDMNSPIKEVSNPLSGYTNEQIEYARIWLQLGPNQAISELNVRKIPSGTAINPNDELSANYPTDVIQLAGSRLVDGSLTYKSNGNGTITVYDVPLRWESTTPESQIKENVSVYTQDIIDHTHEVSIELGNPEEVKSLIEIENIQ